MNTTKNIPYHVGIILDGNGRWAQQHRMPRSMGHKAGADNLDTLSKEIFKTGVKVLSVFAFSTENFKRDPEEVDYLMKLFIHYFKEKLQTFHDYQIRVLFSGRKEPLSDEVWNAMKMMEEKTKDYQNGIFHICLNYGGQTEIVDAIKKIVATHVPVEDITTDTFSKYLYQDLPPLDLVIRTSGEARISNFMLYQMSYAELYFTDVYFPDFTIEKFKEALKWYQARDRRFGGIKK